MFSTFVSTTCTVMMLAGMSQARIATSFPPIFVASLDLSAPPGARRQNGSANGTAGSAALKCVKHPSCHATICVREEQANISTEDMVCTESCDPGTLDCGGTCQYNADAMTCDGFDMNGDFLTSTGISSNATTADTEAGSSTFVAPTPATPVPTSADTTAFEMTLVTGCSDCRDHFNADGHPSSTFKEAYEETVASNIEGVKADDVDAVLNLVMAAVRRVDGDKISAVITIAQENMDASTKQAITGATSETIMAKTDALTALLPEGTTLSVESIKVDEVATASTTSSSTTTSSSVQIGSALSFVCSLLWLIK